MSSNVKVLLVDDNPMVLGMLKQSLATLGQVNTAGDAADALLKAVDDPPDLLVTDYRMPGMDGRQLIEKLRSRPATANFSAIILASKADITERLSQQDPVDDFVEKPFFLKEATRRIKRVIDKIALEKMTKSAPSDGVLRGSLAQMNVIDLMQSLEMGRKSCLLSLSRDDEKCDVYFTEGQVVHAAYGSLKGDQAVFKVLRWTGGNFQLDFEGKTTETSTQLNTQGLLMEGLRLLDESNRDTGEKTEEEDVTVSDSSSRGERADLGGPAVAAALEKKNFRVVAREIVPDEEASIRDILVRLSAQVRFVVTTGGTGIATRDVTPEATRSVCDRLLEGIAERMRAEGSKSTKFAALSRAVCGVRGETLILNLPGKPSGAVESLDAVIDLIPHALQILAGNTRHD
jgi:molybdenum cofactor synthesis domain-containing protein